MERQVPSFARSAFLIHVIVSAILGVVLLLFPNAMGGALGYPVVPGDLQPVVRSYGIMLLLFGGLTSLLANRADLWERVEIIVISEIVYLAASVVFWLVTLILGQGPALGSVVFLVVCLVLLVLFYQSWRQRPT